jgi:hypothetical protein
MRLFVIRTRTVGADNVSVTIVTTHTSIPARVLVIPNQTEGTINILGATYWFAEREPTYKKQSFEFHGVNFTYREVPIKILEVKTSYNGVVETFRAAGNPIPSYDYEPHAKLTDARNEYQAGVIWIFGVRTLFLVRMT